MKDEARGEIMRGTQDEIVSTPAVFEEHGRPTLKEIARIARVNISTVSRAINDSPLLPRDTKDMILAIAEKMNYFPNSLARGLVSQKSETLGIILPKIFFLQGPFFSQVLSGIERISVKHGFSILIASATSKTADRHFPFNLTRARRIDGMLIINENRRIRNLNALKQERVPFVLVNRFIEDTNAPCVAADDIGGGRMAAEHLLRLGHRRIGVVTGSHRVAATTDRVAGYRQALTAFDVPFDKNLLEAGLFQQGVETGARCADRLLSRATRPTAIFALSDELAMGVMQAAKERGLRVPEDLAVVGYDNVTFSAHLSPPLTTIAQNPYAIGATACQMLVDMLEGRTPDQANVLIPVRLVVRDSCGSQSAQGTAQQEGEDA
ncbi:MAG: LacI family transcriptional regulator [Spartobacteria bacterium]|nr:LacI family transcriptional regulator [Spartobacteria bacterium]